jgi:hypothetical protein
VGNIANAERGKNMKKGQSYCEEKKKERAKRVGEELTPAMKV